MRDATRPAAAVLVTGLLAAAASASDLTVDGQTSLSVPLGTVVDVELIGGSGLPAIVLADVSDGPTTIFGESVPLGFTPSVLLLVAGTTDGGGAIGLTLPVPSNPGSVGTTFYLLGAIADGGAPSGVDFSNGVDVTLTGDVDFDVVQLAGNSLGSYPHFEFVRAINDGAPVELMVDPLLHPSVAGATADLYVTVAKDAGAWSSDPSLVDVSGDGPDTVAFHPTDAAANRFTLDSGSLAAVSGTDIGVGYDVVVDLDRDGVLGAGDLIDGFGAEAGFYAVRDVVQPGPYTVIEATYSGGAWLGQNLFYPANIASLSDVPVVIVSHGNGHNYLWYEHIGEHLASYGFVVMSHQNNTGPGIGAAAWTTHNNTDYFFGNLDTIEGGVLDGHVDRHTVIWIGHSRGGEGVVRAYDRIVDGTAVPEHFSGDDIVLISSIAPTDFLGTNSATPHDKPYHLWVGGSDSDVTGCANNNIAQSFHLHDRAENRRASISLHGVGHGDFHDGGGSSWAQGPCLVGRPNTHKIMFGYILPLFRYHTTGDPAAKDFLWRQWEGFRPIGAPTSSCVVVDLQLRGGIETGKLVIDDFQTNPDPTLASSGAAVTHDLDDFDEGRLDDGTSSFSNDAGDEFNGFTLGMSTDDTSGIVFSYFQEDASLAYDLAAGDRDWSGFAFLSFRAAQATRHPLTTHVLGDHVFEVRLTDGAGNTGTLSIGATGGGIEEPYQRSSCGVGFGWGNEMETVRLRLTDFLAGGTDVDLGDVARLEFLFGPSHGNDRGRLGMDDIELTTD